MAAKDDLGRRGEDIAVRYLEHQGMVVLSRNWRCRAGELDVVATDAHQHSSNIYTCALTSTPASPKIAPATNSASPGNARTA
ncbi:YraN family protein [Pseudonocardia thermophila]|uniref:YraN family protein n=1 Tax=Pseudonocardia thermophila TaxID=1848 RepID=UPI003CD0C654